MDNEEVVKHLNEIKDELKTIRKEVDDLEHNNKLGVWILSGLLTDVIVSSDLFGGLKSILPTHSNFK